jgi:hypothetical protein
VRTQSPRASHHTAPCPLRTRMPSLPLISSLSH